MYTLIIVHINVIHMYNRCGSSNSVLKYIHTSTLTGCFTHDSKYQCLMQYSSTFGVRYRADLQPGRLGWVQPISRFADVGGR